MCGGVGGLVTATSTIAKTLCSKWTLLIKVSFANYVFNFLTSLFFSKIPTIQDWIHFWFIWTWRNKCWINYQGLFIKILAKFMLKPMSKNLTVWKFQDFCIIEILCEINFVDSRNAKNCQFCHFRGSELCSFGKFPPSKSAKIHKN